MRISAALGAFWCLLGHAVGDTDDGSSCNAVVFERTDVALGVRTMVVEDATKSRSLVLTPAEDKTEPCTLSWWLDHNPQGVVRCSSASGNSSQTGSSLVAATDSSDKTTCDPSACQVDSSTVDLGYVRTMLASALYTPKSKAMSALCIELGCRSRIRRTKLAGTLLEAAPEVQWEPRAHGPRKVLVIGLGSSTMALWLRRWLPETELHVAELVPSVVAAAPCFGLDPQAGGNRDLLHLHAGDGRAYLASRSDGEFDAILVDAFDSNASLPACMRTREFFSLARKKLAPGGALSLNLLLGNSGQPTHVLKSLVEGFGDATKPWVGDAPGAEGIQNIVTMFAPGRTEGANSQLALKKDVAPSPASASATSATDRAKAWFNRAQWRMIPNRDIEAAKALHDETECPHARD